MTTALRRRRKQESMNTRVTIDHKPAMKVERLRLLLIVGLATLLAATHAPAQTWQTVDDFQYVSGQSSWLYCLGVDAHGNVYTVGEAYDSTSNQHALVRRSTDQGTSWQTVDDYLGPGGLGAIFWGFGIDATQNLYAVGWTRYDGQMHWIVRRSSDQGATWTTVDDYTDPTTRSPYAGGVAADRAGSVYVVGAGTSLSDPFVRDWIVRKSGDAGATWTTVDHLPGGGIPNCAVCTSAGVFVAGNGTIRMSADAGVSWSTVAHPYTYVGSTPDLTSDSAGNLYLGATSNRYWIVQKGSKDGTSWSTMDSFQYSPGAAAVAIGMGTDASGNVYAVGSGGTNYGLAHWLVRKSADQGATWSTVDDYQYLDGAPANCFGSDASGNLYVGGSAGLDYTGAAHWRVRKLAAAQPVTPPALRVSFSAGGLTLSWPLLSTGFMLESTPSLTSPNWQPAPETPVAANSQWIVTVARDRAARCFRLHQQ
jgi:hypothetical protein